MRKVIFIAGTSYSGSSMLDMMLGSSDSSFSIGEVRALFYPNKKYHINPPCGCGDSTCDIWKTIKKAGASNLYTELFKMFGEIETIIDSSKNYFWIAKQKKILKKIGIRSEILLIWKSPGEFALSRFKRGKSKQWKSAWLNYHKLIFSLNEYCNIKTVSYKDLAINPEKKLKQICKAFKISFSPNMLSFWKKKHHMLFGNTIAKYHMYDKDNEHFVKSLSNLSKNEIKFDSEKNILDSRHRSIYYTDSYKSILPERILSDIEKKKIFGETIRQLRSMDVDIKKYDLNGNVIPKNLLHSKTLLSLKSLKYFLKNKMFYLQNKL